MTYQSAELLNQLAEHGWDVEHIENAVSEGPKLEWWADEIWILRSVWSPQDCRAYVTFLVDPQTPTEGRRRGEGVWAVKASLKRPRQWMQEEARHA